MLTGISDPITVPEESACRSCENYQFTTTGNYKIHSTTLLSHIPFDGASITPEMIDATIFVNDEETKLSFPTTVQTQNFITARYIGQVPYTVYGGDNTSSGTQFIMKCVDKILTDPKYRIFGTEDAIRGVYEKDLSGGES